MYWSQVGLADGTDEGTVFIERRLDPYIAYLSRFASYLLESCTILSSFPFRWLYWEKHKHCQIFFFHFFGSGSTLIMGGMWGSGKVVRWISFRFKIQISIFFANWNFLFNIKVKPGRLTVHPWGQLAIKFLHRWTPLSVKLFWFTSQGDDDVEHAQAVVVVYCLKSISTWL